MNKFCTLKFPYDIDIIFQKDSSQSIYEHQEKISHILPKITENEVITFIDNNPFMKVPKECNKSDGLYIMINENHLFANNNIYAYIVNNSIVGIIQTFKQTTTRWEIPGPFCRIYMEHSEIGYVECTYVIENYPVLFNLNFYSDNNLYDKDYFLYNICGNNKKLTVVNNKGCRQTMKIKRNKLALVAPSLYQCI